MLSNNSIVLNTQQIALNKALSRAIEENIKVFGSEMLPDGAIYTVSSSNGKETYRTVLRYIPFHGLVSNCSCPAGSGYGRMPLVCKHVAAANLNHHPLLNLVAGVKFNGNVLSWRGTQFNVLSVNEHALNRVITDMWEVLEGFKANSQVSEGFAISLIKHFETVLDSIAAALAIRYSQAA